MERRKLNSLSALILSNNAPDVLPINYLRNSKYTIGRSNESSLKLSQRQISRKHCTLEKIGPQKWIITAHKNVTVNGCPLILDDPTTLICGDKIKLAGVVVFEYKCAPDQNRHCCQDFKNNLLPKYNIDSDSGKSYPISSQLTPSTQANFPTSCITQLIETSDYVTVNTPNDINSHFTTAKLTDVQPLPFQGSKNTGSLLKMKDLENNLENYMCNLEALKSDLILFNPKLKDELKFRLSILKQLHELIISQNLNTIFHYNENIDAANKVIETSSSFLKEYHANSDYSDKNSKEIDYEEKLNRIILMVNNLLHENTKLLLRGMNKISDDSSNVEHFMCINNNAVEKEKSLANSHSMKSESTSSNEAKIQLLEMKLKEKNKLEFELEAVKEENEALENKVTELKRIVANMEVVELELKVLQETTKYKEDDKRSKDALEFTISNLKKELFSLKEENDKLTSSTGELKEEVFSLKQKCEELEQKLNTKDMIETKSFSGCAGINIIDGYCCDTFRQMKSNLTDLMEREFNCSICGDMFIDATVTNCNHIFCSYCLKEWKRKKKQCPFCRTNITKECRATVVDEFITNLSKLICEKMYSERIQMINERKVAGTPPAKRARTRRLHRVAVVGPAFVNPNIQIHTVYPYISNEQ